MLRPFVEKGPSQLPLKRGYNGRSIGKRIEQRHLNERFQRQLVLVWIEWGVAAGVCNSL
jgi:hypothetical protein